MGLLKCLHVLLKVLETLEKIREFRTLFFSQKCPVTQFITLGIVRLPGISRTASENTNLVINKCLDIFSIHPVYIFLQIKSIVFIRLGDQKSPFIYKLCVTGFRTHRESSLRYTRNWLVYKYKYVFIFIALGNKNKNSLRLKSSQNCSILKFKFH